MNVAEFFRVYPVRAPGIQWLLGAGASAGAGIPTAYNLIWQFKRTLFCAAQGVSVHAVPDLGDPAVRARLQHYCDSTGLFPPEDAEDEYAAYFEATYPDDADRRRYLDRTVSGGTPSVGHRALAALMVADKARGVWTTNFDRMVEDAAAAAFGGTGRLVVASLDAPERAMEALNEGRWPLLGKLHGDFQSRRLKNTTAELRTQDEKMRRALVEACKRYGLAVVGYSGRDDSVMGALRDGIDGGQGYPLGLFWFQRSGGSPLPAVKQLIADAVAAGIDAHIVEAETFDELVADLLQQIPDVPAEVAAQLNARANRVSNAPIPAVSRKWPMVRTNALPVIAAPSICRRVKCDIGGTREVLDAVGTAETDVLVGRNQFGVIAFGADADVRKTFEPFGITAFDVHSIEPHRFRYESAEFGIVYAALARALANICPPRPGAPPQWVSPAGGFGDGGRCGADATPQSGDAHARGGASDGDHLGRSSAHPAGLPA